MEEQRTCREGNQYTATSHHRDNRDHRIREGQRIKVDPIRHTEEHRDENDVPTPLKRRALLPVRIPKRQQDHTHDRQLIQVKPHLHCHHIHATHQMLIIQTAYGTHRDGNQHEPNPSVMGKADALLPSRSGKQVK